MERDLGKQAVAVLECYAWSPRGQLSHTKIQMEMEKQIWIQLQNQAVSVRVQILKEINKLLTKKCFSKGKLSLQNRMFFWTTSKWGEGGHFQFKILYCRFLLVYFQKKNVGGGQGWFGHCQKKNIWFFRDRLNQVPMRLWIDIRQDRATDISHFNVRGESKIQIML